VSEEGEKGLTNEVLALLDTGGEVSGGGAIERESRRDLITLVIEVNCHCWVDRDILLEGIS
jgi:hypothetical protein